MSPRRPPGTIHDGIMQFYRTVMHVNDTAASMLLTLAPLQILAGYSRFVIRNAGFSGLDNCQPDSVHRPEAVLNLPDAIPATQTFNKQLFGFHGSSIAVTGLSVPKDRGEGTSQCYRIPEICYTAI